MLCPRRLSLPTRRRPAESAGSNTSQAGRRPHRLAAKLCKGALRGKVTLTSGRGVSHAMHQTGLLDILLAGDFNPALRAELPGSMRAALDGDASPLLRLSVRGAG